jgi:hypothetical protein
VDALNHPFQPGAKVAVIVQNGWREPHGYRFAVVAKVLKSGRFTLEGSPQQYRPYGPSGFEKYWHGVATGESNARLRILDAASEPEIAAQNAKADRARRFANACHALDREPFSELVTDEVVAHLEAAVSIIKPKKVAA